MAAEQDRKFKEQQQQRQEEEQQQQQQQQRNMFTGGAGKDDNNDWNGMGNGSHNGSNNGSTTNDSNSPLKRRISEVSDTDTQPTRPPPPLIGPLYHYEQTPQIIDPPYQPRFPHSNNNPLTSNPPYEDQKRRPDPNDDTIGSDLDDSDDEGEIDSENEDEDMPLMLCSYDKVHRTKNKWRANLANGVVCIHGREWVFEKGNGEYEW
jgi:hypothetical protein